MRMLLKFTVPRTLMSWATYSSIDAPWMLNTNEFAIVFIHFPQAERARSRPSRRIRNSRTVGITSHSWYNEEIRFVRHAWVKTRINNNKTMQCIFYCDSFPVIQRRTQQRLLNGHKSPMAISLTPISPMMEFSITSTHSVNALLSETNSTRAHLIVRMAFHILSACHRCWYCITSSNGLSIDSLPFCCFQNKSDEGRSDNSQSMMPRRGRGEFEFKFENKMMITKIDCWLEKDSCVSLGQSATFFR